MLRYSSKAWRIEFAAPHAKLFMLAAGLFIINILVVNSLDSGNGILPNLYMVKLGLCLVLTIVILIAFVFGVLILLFDYKRCQLEHKIKVGLYYHGYGNPLHLKDGEYLPKIKVKQLENDVYLLTVDCSSVSAENLQKMPSIISSTLNGKQAQYAVTIVNTDTAYNYVQFYIENVTVDKSFTFKNVDEMKPPHPTKIRIQKGTNIDLTTSGSMLVAGKTRSGKTTGIIAMLIQALMWGRDGYGSKITIIDPKRAELSMLPFVVSVDDDGEARSILQALKDFEATIKIRQAYLNKNLLKVGDAIHWWELGMHPSFLFIDEYVACRSLFPKKADKGSDYCLMTFDNILKRIVTMGASAGCFVIISIAEASVEEGGLPSMLRNAMTTKILFKPSLTEGRLIWDSSKLDNFPERVYNAGDCWFSSTDGEHDDVTFAHFPIMDFQVYRELGNLLKKYYDESADGGSPQDGARPE